MVSVTKPVLSLHKVCLLQHCKAIETIMQSQKYLQCKQLIQPIRITDTKIMMSKLCVHWSCANLGC